MSGSDFRFWLEGIWYDLTNLGTADLPSLFFRLVLLLLVVFFGAFFLRVALTVLGGLARSYVLPVVQLVWDVLTYPVRLPFRITRRVWRRVQDGRRYRAALARERQLREEEALKRLEEERRERERIAELQKVLKVD